jgi:hypothetical protein
MKKLNIFLIEKINSYNLEMIYNYFKSGLDCYNKLGGNYFIKVGEDIEGDTFETLEEWNNYPYKDKIMKEANHFKYYLRTLKENKPWYYHHHMV